MHKLVVIGVGLIGASFALALKRGGHVAQVVGVGRSRGNLDTARARGAIDHVAPTVGDAVQGADFVFVATPIGAMSEAFAMMAPHLAMHAVVTDAGSAKQSVIAAARARLGTRATAFVPGHPIAGSEASGAEAATADLYRGRETILTPLPETSADAVARVKRAWEQCGARVTEMSPAEHDEALAAVSHLPHLLSYALMEELASRSNGAGVLAHAGTGFRDFTRLAGSHPEMWRDICSANREALLAELQRYEGALERLRTLLDQGDFAGLARILHAAREARDAWVAARLSDG